MNAKKICALLLCALLVATALSACDKSENPTPTPTPTPKPATPTPDGGATPAPQGAEFSGIDFSNGNMDFLGLWQKPSDSSPDTALELVDYKGGKAVKITPDGGSVPYVVVDASSILGARVTDLYTVEIEMAVEHPDGVFAAVSGEILAFSGTERDQSKAEWSVYLESKNPNFARMTLDKPEKRFVTGAHNFFILNRKVDNAVTAGGNPGILYITRIGFLDEGGNYLPVDDNAVFDAPEGFNDLKTSVVHLYDMNAINSDTQMGWLTDGVDGTDSPYTAEQFANAITLVLEFAEPPVGGMQIIWQGDGDGWNWNQTDGVIPDDGLSETTLTVDLASTLQNYDKLKESTQIKLFLGYYSDNIADLGIVSAYIVTEAPATYVIELGEMNAVNSESQMGWLTNGVDGVESPYTAEMFNNAISLVLEFAEPPVGGMQVIWQGDGDGWNWNQTDGVIPDDGLSETKLTIDLASTLEHFDSFQESTQIKFFLGYYSDNIADLGITNAYFIAHAD